MKSEKRIVLLFLVFLFVSGVVAVAQEQITLTTYYPSPRGEYETLRLFPSNVGGNEGDPCAEVGLIYLQQATNQVLICDGATNTWLPVGSGSYWVLDTGTVPNSLYPKDPAWYVGIPTTPSYRLHVDGGTGIGIRTRGDINALVATSDPASGVGISTFDASLALYAEGTTLGASTGVTGFGNDFGVVGGYNSTPGPPSTLFAGVRGYGIQHGVRGTGLGPGRTIGVRGETAVAGVAGTPSYGVYGEAPTTGESYGVYGTGRFGVRATGSLVGIAGWITSGTPMAAIYGWNNTPTGGTGVIGDADGSGANFGVHANANGGGTANNTALLATASSGTQTTGINVTAGFSSSGINTAIRAAAGGAFPPLEGNTGVSAASTGPAGSTVHAVRGEAGGGLNNYGVRGRATAGLGNTAYGVYGEAAGGGNLWGVWSAGRIGTANPQASATKMIFDIAELIATTPEVEAGDVVIIHPEGRKLTRTNQPYDERVAGVISEKPWFSLGDKEKANQEEPGHNFQYLTLAGQVECKVDASYGEIKPGDWLTTSPTPGHVMVVKDKSRAHGTIIGKALQGLKEGKGKILILAKIG